MHSPQKDWQGVRTGDEDGARFKACLDGMGPFYASMGGTAVWQ